MNNVRTLAAYLPQYHRVKENDEWWGDGFTDWVAVKNADKLFDEHYQPHTPLNLNYYNLLDKNVLQWQASLAKKYLIDGFVFYHYWFKNGYKILEKPAEVLLKHNGIDMPFCFCWATATWARTWSKLKNSNAWADKYEKNIVDFKMNTSPVLLEQQYGDINEWEEHFRYLLPFFCDERYITCDGCPVFIFDESEKMPCQERMILYWKNRAVEEGLPGLYVITMHTETCLRNIADAKIEGMSFSNESRIVNNDSLNFYDYDKLWKSYLSQPPLESIKTLWWGIVSYDDTPRRGKNGKILVKSSPEKFKKYFRSLFFKSLKESAPFVFINAWNEWGEGMHLEPDEKYQYGYLEAVRDVICECRNLSKIDSSDRFLVDLNYKYALSQYENEIKDYRMGYNLMRQWIQMKDEKNALKLWLTKHKNPVFAIYGWNEDGKRMYHELTENNANVAYIVDDKVNADDIQTQFCSTKDCLPKCDLMIVTIMRDFDNILRDSRKYSFPFISLYEFLYNVCFHI